MEKKVSNVLLISALCSKDMINKLYKLNHKDPGYAIQKFHRQLMLGLVANTVSVSTCSAISVSPKSVKKVFWAERKEKLEGINYNYLFFLNLPIVRNLCLFINSFIFTLLWGIKNKRNGAIITDVLNKSVAYGGFFASKIIGMRNVAIITDMPGMTVTTKMEDYNVIKGTFYGRTIRNYSGFIYISELSDSIINLNHKPYVVVEGSVDAEYTTTPLMTTNSISTILYAGGLREEYGLKILIEAFMLMKHKDVILVFYGNGPFAQGIKDYEGLCSRIEYRGVLPNEMIMQEESKATFLVNPRPTNLALTKYSFPSKTHEYMLTGVPTVTTHLAGIPSEYDDYLFYIEDETAQGIANLFDSLLDQNPDEIKRKGMAAREFVLREKNNIKQAEKMLGFMTELLNR